MGQDPENRSTRRTVLKCIGGVAAGLGISSAGSAKNSTNNPVNADFDPSDDSSTGKFILDIFNHASRSSNEEIKQLREESLRNLDDQQLSSIKSSIEKYSKLRYQTEFTVTSTNTRTRASSGLNLNPREWTSFEHTIEATIDLFLCQPGMFVPRCDTYSFDAYEYTHTLEWYFDGNTVSDGYSTVNAEGSDYALVAWTYEGDAVDETSYHPEDLYVRSRRKGGIH